MEKPLRERYYSTEDHFARYFYSFSFSTLSSFTLFLLLAQHSFCSLERKSEEEERASVDKENERIEILAGKRVYASNSAQRLSSFIAFLLALTPEPWGVTGRPWGK